MTTTISCRQCRLHAVCDAPFASTLAPKEGLFQKILRLNPKQALVDAQGKAAKGFYLLREGCVKLARVDAQGKEHIDWIYFPGELLGLEYLASPHPEMNLIAVKSSELCELSPVTLHQLLGNNDGFRTDFLQWVSTRFYYQKNFAHYTAEQKVAAFLLMIVERLATNITETWTFPFGRELMATYLGLAPETVSRILQAFQQAHWLALEGRNCQILDFAALKAVVP